MKKAVITGITGQDGSYLAELLLAKGYQVHGIVRRTSTSNRERIDHLSGHKNLLLHYGDLADPTSLRRVIFNTRPDEIYNLAAQSHVRISFDMPEYTLNVTGLAVGQLLEIARELNQKKKVKFYQASSSEMFGSAKPPQDETTLFQPRSPYAHAKILAYNLVRQYRDAYGLFAVNGILFNHESPRRGENFVTRKISLAAARIASGSKEPISFGNLDARRDWGYSPEYMEAAWLMLQQPKPDDYVIGTGESHSVKDFMTAAFSHVDIKNWKKYIKVDRQFYRPTEVDNLIANTTKAKKMLKWQPKVKFKELVKIMVEADLEKLKNQKHEFKK